MKLKELRLQKGFTQRQIADYIGCLPSVYSRYENGDREPSIEVLILLSRFLGVSIDFLVENEVSDSSQELSAYEIALINAAKYVCHWDPTFAAYLAKKRAEGKHYNVAISHAAKKLVRLIYAMEKSGQPYRPAA